RTLMRAVDLVNHGYPMEGLIVGFALLDHLTQDFIKQKMSHLSSPEKSTLLRQIESSRLSTYLGPLLKTLTGESPLDDRTTNEMLKWLNTLRNKTLHENSGCSSEDARKALDFILELLTYYQTRGAELTLPKSLNYWLYL
ncbi:MAG: hypothetical protein R2854_31640, partial [Caldilineaceae bacterium]